MSSLVMLILGLLAPSPGSKAFAATPRDVEDARCPFSSPGLVVETVDSESPGFHAGFLPGDRILSWCRPPSGGGDCVERTDYRTSFGWRDIELEEVPRGGVVVEGTRGPESHRWSLLPTSQGLTVAPLLRGELAEIYQTARARKQADDLASAGLELERATELASENHCPAVELWLRYQVAKLRVETRQWSEADAALQVAVAKARALRATQAEAFLRQEWWSMLLQQGEATRARQQLEIALRLEERARPGSVSVALVLTRLGFTAFQQDNLDESNRWSRRAYDLVHRAAPGSGAEAAAANNLAASLAAYGDLAQAELYLARTLAIQEKFAPSDPGIVLYLRNYGEMLLSRGDFATAEATFLRARRILESVNPGSLEPAATTLHLLGRTAEQRGDYDAAESLFRRELALLEKLDPGGDLMREHLMSLARLALLQHRGDSSADSWQRALEISDKLNPRGPGTASCLVGLADAMRLQGKGPEAEKLLQRAMAIWQEINPQAADAGSIHLKLGILLLEQGNAEAAEAHLRASIRILEQYGVLLPESYRALARLQARNGQVEEAATSYEAAIDALEAQGMRLGGPKESQWLYGSSFGDLYFEAAEHQIALARPQDAWRLVERGRARGFQEMLAQRDLRFERDLSGPLYAERHRLDADYDRVQKALADWVPEQGSETKEALLDRLRDLRLEQADVQERLRRSSSRFGALESPGPLGLAAARSALDPGTVLLTYAIGETRSFLFVIEAEGAPGPGFSFYPLAIGKEDLQKEVEAFRNLLDQPGSLLSALKERGRRLHDLLIRPAEPVLGRADRWLISPDGPLHSLPFAALLDGDHYLAESKPIHTTASVAVYREIRAARPEGHSAPATELLIAGDPFYSMATVTDPQVRAALRRGLKLEPLPATRNEVNAISGLFPGARILLGRDATEDAIKTLAPQARRLHFACHGLLDERFPLNSGLAFSIPEHPEEGRDNGLLQAWEIFEQMRLDADLVTLSACDTGLGKEMGGEGLVGLVRAFQFAGARSVLATQWGVADDATADLMKRFYGYLKAGKTKDEALRNAQVDLIHGRAFAHPYYWAAFQLTGDWK